MQYGLNAQFPEIMGQKYRLNAMFTTYSGFFIIYDIFSNFNLSWVPRCYKRQRSEEGFETLVPMQITMDKLVARAGELGEE